MKSGEKMASAQQCVCAIVGVRCKFVVCVSNYVRSRSTVTEQVAKIIPYGHSFWLLSPQRHIHEHCRSLPQ